MYRIIDGKKIASDFSNNIKKEIVSLKENNREITLAIIQVGDNPASTVYKNSKIKKCKEFQINVKEYNFDEFVNENEVIDLIHKLNTDSSITGIFIEMPLPEHLDSNKIINEIIFNKDIEGITDKNLGKIFNDNNGILPATANSCLNILKNENINIAGKNIVVLGRSKILGKPLSFMLLNENATVTICHSFTQNLKDITNKADILIVAINKEKFIDETYIKDNAVVIDVGIHRNVVYGKSVITGDVDFEKVKNKTSYITPVPGGVGPLTVVMLINNLLISKKLYG